MHLGLVCTYGDLDEKRQNTSYLSMTVYMLNVGIIPLIASSLFSTNV